MKFFNQTRTFVRVIRRYFNAYGGWVSVLESPFFLVSLVVTIVNYANWISPKWIVLSQSILPNLLGFSLGAYAILFGLITNRLKNALRNVKNKSGIDYLSEINATFLHFICMQVLSIFWSFIFSGSLLYDLFALNGHILWGYGRIAFIVIFLIGSFIGHFLLIYSVLLSVASAIAVYRLANIADPDDK